MTVDAEKKALLKIASLAMAPAPLRRLLGEGSAEELLGLPARQWAGRGGFPEENAKVLREKAAAFDCDAELEAAERLRADLIFPDDARYPDLLKEIADPPPLLYARGALANGAAALAIVGSRRPTAYGRRMARALAGEAAAGGTVVVSGLARGIDTEAHRAALGARGATWAVLGSGLGRLYPPENAALADAIVAGGGCVLSELPLSAAPLPEHFPRRNRIVSGLSWGTVVVEGQINSGSLITARSAVAQGREVFAVPGPADSRLSEAPHRLIQEGAKIIHSIKEAWDELPPGCRPPGPQGRGAAAGGGLAKQQQKILQLIGSESCSLEALSEGTGLSLPSLSGLLWEMEAEDLVVPIEGQRYAKK